MHNTSKRAFIMLGVVIIFIGGLAFLATTYFFNGTKWATHRANSHIYSGGQISSAGTIYDSEGKILANTSDGERKFNDNVTIRKATLHAVGDTQGFMSTGVHSQYESELTGYNILTGIYYLKKYGMGNDITLSLKSSVCAAAYNALNEKKGTVGVYNYKTGETVCMVSSPSYDVLNKPSKKDMESDKYKGAYINKFLSSTYTPGSTFKVITAISAIENIPDIYSKKFTCNGKLVIGNNKVICHSVHGTMNFEKALNVSCNSAFAQIALELGKENLQKTGEKLGLTSTFKMDRTEIAKGALDLSSAINIDLGWAGIGQFTTMVNPCQMMSVMGAIANNGKAMKPYYIKEITAPSGIKTYKASSSTLSTVELDADTAYRIKKLLRSNVENYYGDSAFPGLEVCGKTGTAEVGDELTGDNALFVGFSQDEKFPYAVIVIVENTNSTGRGLAVPIANKVLQAVKQLEK